LWRSEDEKFMIDEAGGDFELKSLIFKKTRIIVKVASDE
jgi:hypothetical protein